MSGVTKVGGILWREYDDEVIEMLDKYGNAVGVDSPPAVTEPPELDRDISITFILL
jgi:hypothetical protein